MKYFNLYAHNLVVTGKSRSAIYNFKDNKIHFIPNILSQILREIEYQTYNDYISSFNNREQQLMEKYFKFLIQNDLGFFTDNINNFPKLSFDWYSPFKIGRSSIEIDMAENTLSAILTQLDELGCRYVEMIASHEKIRISDFNNLIQLTDGKVFRSITLLIKYSSRLNEAQMKKWAMDFGKLSRLVIYSSPFRKDIVENFVKIEYREESISEMKSRRPRYIVNYKYFCESLNYNPYYNRRICVSHDGLIKNCLSHKKSFGNVKTTKLRDVISDSEFTDLWYASPDKITDIKDSELRYCLCLDSELIKIGSDLYRFS